MNAYGFGNGDPVNYSDPFGLWPDWLHALGDELKGIPATIRRNWDKLLGARNPLDPTPHPDDIDMTPPPVEERPAKEPGQAGEHANGPKIETDAEGNVTITIPKPSAKIAWDNLKTIWHGLRTAIDDAARMNDRALHGDPLSSGVIPAVPSAGAAAASAVP